MDLGQRTLRCATPVRGDVARPDNAKRSGGQRSYDTGRE